MPSKLINVFKGAGGLDLNRMLCYFLEGKLGP